MSLLRPLPLPFLKNVPFRFTTEGDDSISWVSFIRLVLSLTADLSIIGWALAYIGRSPGIPSWVANCMAVGIISVGTVVYVLSANEFMQLVNKNKSVSGRTWRFIAGYAFVFLMSIVPPVYGLANGIHQPSPKTCLQPSAGAH